jgi:hypothetical protein
MGLNAAWISVYMILVATACHDRPLSSHPNISEAVHMRQSHI